MFCSFFKNKNSFSKFRTFTYYLPAPPARRTGYQEKEFDGLTHHLTSLGFEIANIKTQAHSESEKAGIWIICLLRAPTQEIYQKKIQFDSSILGESVNQDNIPLDPSILHD